MFRSGAEHWSASRRVLKTLQFGMVHALIGIPIGAALALSIGGAYFMFVYLRAFHRTGSSNDATLESTTAHTAYNGSHHRCRGHRHRGDRFRRLVGQLMNAEPVDIDIVRDRSVTITFDDGMRVRVPGRGAAVGVPVRHLPRPARAGPGGLAATRSTRRRSPSSTPSSVARGACRSTGATATARASTRGRSCAGGGRPASTGPWSSIRSRCRAASGLTAPPTTTLGSLRCHGSPSAAGAAEPGGAFLGHAAVLSPSRSRSGPQLHPLRQGGLQRVPGAGGRRFALPRLRQGGPTRRRHPRQVLERPPAHADDLRAHGHQLRRCSCGSRSPTRARSAAASGISQRAVRSGPQRRSSSPAVRVDHYVQPDSGTGWSSSGFLHFGIIHIAFNMLHAVPTGPAARTSTRAALKFTMLYVAALLGGSLGVLHLRPARIVGRRVRRRVRADGRRRGRTAAPGRQRRSAPGSAPRCC